MTNELKLMYIRPSTITTFYHDSVSTATAHKRLRGLNSINYERHLLVIERINFQRYVLIEGFREYSALILLQPHKPVMCNVINTTNEKEQLLRILRKVITFETTSWYFKYVHIQKLRNIYSMDMEEISSATNQPLSTINNFVFRDEIPIYIQKRAMLNRASPTLINKIARSKYLYDPMKIILLERATLPKSHSLRLKERQFEHVKLFCRKFYLSTKEVNNPKLITSLTETLLDGDEQLLGLWRNELTFTRNNRKTIVLNIGNSPATK